MEKNLGPALVLGSTKEGQSILGFVFLHSLLSGTFNNT